MPKSVLTLGTFDGVHRGHLALVRKVVSRARARRAQSVVLSFDMPPRHAGEPPAKPVLLSTLSEKLAMLKRSGIDHVHVMVFDRKTASTPPEDFFEKTIRERFGAVEMIVGPKVAFGKDRSGRLPLLRRLGREKNVRIHVVSSVDGGSGAVSSRRIRALLSRGSVEKANKLLGYPYSVAGKVVHGDHRGRTLGFPTANIQMEPGKMLPRGVYWVKVLRGDTFPLTAKSAMKGMDGLCNIGTRPTFTPREQAVHCEVFVLADSAPLRLYGRKLRVVFLRRIRAERRFPSKGSLQRQIVKDVLTVKEMMRLYRKAHFSI